MGFTDNGVNLFGLRILVRHGLSTPPNLTNLKSQLTRLGQSQTLRINYHSIDPVPGYPFFQRTLFAATDILSGETYFSLV